jgi:hypothetical protein
MKSRKAELQDEGWEKRTTIGEPKLSEIVAEYESLGFEVRLEPVNFDELDEKCQKCYGTHPDKFRTVYVRRKHC